MKEIIEKLIKLTQDGEIKWYIERDENSIKYNMKCEKLKKFNDLQLILDVQTGHIAFDTNKYGFSSRTKYRWLWQNELKNLLETIESTTDFISEFKEWVDCYNILEIEETLHTWKLPDE